MNLYAPSIFFHQIAENENSVSLNFLLDETDESDSLYNSRYERGVPQRNCMYNRRRTSIAGQPGTMCRECKSDYIISLLLLASLCFSTNRTHITQTAGYGGGGAGTIGLELKVTYKSDLNNQMTAQRTPVYNKHNLP